MSDFTEIDPVSGIRSDFTWNENAQEYSILRSADVEPNLDHSKRMANDTDVSKQGIKQGWWQYASLPPIVIIQMRAKGIDVFNRDHQDRMFAEINTSYPHLKTTQGNQGGKAKQIYLG